MTLSITTLCIECHYAECRDCYAESRYPECHYAECSYAECRVADEVTFEESAWVPIHKTSNERLTIKISIGAR